MKKSSRENIKNQLCKKLILNGFRDNSRFFSKPTNMVSFTKSNIKEDVTYTLYPTYFEIYERSYPAKEGW